MNIFGNVSKNAKVCMVYEPMWSIFFGIISAFGPLYMSKLGLSPVQIGTITTTGLLSSAFFYLIAAPLTNKMGRKRTTFIFDLISWSGAMLIWAIAQNFWFFFAAALVNAAGKIVGISWTCLVVEDTPPESRARLYGFFQITQTISGLFAPIASVLIASFGMVTAMRGVYGLGFLSITAMILLRNLGVTETKAGKQLVQEYSDVHILTCVRAYIFSIGKVFHKRDNILFAFLYFFMITIYILNSTFQVMYLNETNGISVAAISMALGLNAAVFILFYLFALPRMRRLGDLKSLCVGFGMCLIGSILFLFIPYGSLAFYLPTILILGQGSYISATFRDTAFMNMQGELEKADMFSGVLTLTTIATIPVGYLAGLIYKSNPRILFYIIMGMYVLCCLLGLVLLQRAKRKSAPVQCSQ